jgi:hypothetical protein
MHELTRVRDPSVGVHTCHTPDCMIMVPVLLTRDAQIALYSAIALYFQ